MENNKKRAASLVTTSNLLKIAREKFSLHGFADTSLEMIVESAGMTRGAVYHHYKNKKELFLAVLHQVQVDIGKYVEKKAMLSEEVWEQLILGCVAFIECATLPENKRILLVDAPNAVGWLEWKKADTENAQSHLEEQLRLIASKGELVDIDVRLVTAMISGALNELAISISQSDGISPAEIHTPVFHLLRGFRKNGAKI